MYALEVIAPGHTESTSQYRSAEENLMLKPFPFLLYLVTSENALSMLREKLSKKSFLSEKFEMISGEGAFAKTV